MACRLHQEDLGGCGVEIVWLSECLALVLPFVGSGGHSINSELRQTSIHSWPVDLPFCVFKPNNGRHGYMLACLWILLLARVSPDAFVAIRDDMSLAALCSCLFILQMLNSYDRISEPIAERSLGRASNMQNWPDKRPLGTVKSFDGHAALHLCSQPYSMHDISMAALHQTRSLRKRIVLFTVIQSVLHTHI